ncbi:ABC transporter permease [Tepidibacillus marianensis]|uniref:ABC transporter permease n=1 Tax=Tepidibacillus marianensis TaxID=3131995 RepID=UPI0030D4EEC7
MRRSTHLFSWMRFRSIVRKEVLQIRRDPPSLAIALLMPIMMLLLFGYAVNSDIDHLSTGVWDQDKSPESRAFIQNLVNTQSFEIVNHANSYQEIQEQMDLGKIKVGIVIPPDYSHLLDKGQGSTVQILIDGTEPNAAKTALSQAELTVQHQAIEHQQQQLSKQGIGEIESSISIEPRILYNPTMKSLVFNIPALIGLIMQNVTAILTAFALVREKERGTMEQLIVTPVRPIELILGKLVPYVGIGLFSFSIVLLTGVYWFGVPVKGSIPLLMLLSLLFLITTLAIGILISTVSKTQLQAMQMSFAFILPSVLLSGFIFPRETMPTIIQWIGGIIPLTYFLEILRGIFLKGIGLDYLWHETLILGIFTFVICAVAIMKFRKRIE